MFEYIKKNSSLLCKEIQSKDEKNLIENKTMFLFYNKTINEDFKSEFERIYEFYKNKLDE